MTPGIAREIEELLIATRAGESRVARPSPAPSAAFRPRSLPRPAHAFGRRGEADPAYGPMTEPVVELLDRARALTSDEIERLAASARRVCSGRHYAEALLEMQHAAETSGRASLSGLAGSQARQLVVRVADQRTPSIEVDDVRWNVVGQQAAWAAGDAAQALVVGDLLPERHLRVLTSAWTVLAGA